MAEYFVVYNDNDEEIAYLVVAKQEWNNILRVWDIGIDPQFQRQGIGKQLIQYAEKRAKEWKCRAVVLECQSSNYPAIQFYLSCGFSLSGFDLINYTNDDVKRHEIRLEMSKKLE